VLGELSGSSLTAKLIGGMVGALVGAFLLAPGRHHGRRVVGVGLLLLLLTMLRGAGTALANALRGRRAQVRSAPRAGASAQLAPQSWLAVAVVGAAFFGVGTTAAAVTHQLSTKSDSHKTLSDKSQPAPAPAVAGPHGPSTRPGPATTTAPAPAPVPNRPARVVTSLTGTFGRPATPNGGHTVDLTVLDRLHPTGDPTASGPVRIRIGGRRGPTIGSGAIVAGHMHLTLPPGDPGANSVAAYYLGDRAHEPSAVCLIRSIDRVACP
jgi:hypothetical protein